MGVDLIGKETSTHFNWANWSYLLSVGRNPGWRPAGTSSPERNIMDGSEVLFPDWEGGYGSNDGQKVTVDDATNLAAALETYLATAPVEHVGFIRRFITFCRKSDGFYIT